MTQLTLPRIQLLLVAIAAAWLTTTCAPKQPVVEATPTPPATTETIVLLPDAETGVVGRAYVSNSAGAVDLAAGRDSTRVGDGPPGQVSTLAEGEVDRLFGDALAALPPAPRRFTLHFRFESDELTEESRALVPVILKAVTERVVPDVVVIGHTDTTGSTQANFELGLKRATTIRNLLVKAGLSADALEVISHGERDPLVKTADGTLEPRNRRVEIAVR
jgi:outer membrane protein OmpA-like peptidoglycan-associated protein